MKFNQQVILKHVGGITAKWVSDDWSWMAIATYYQQEKEGKNVDGETVKIKTWVLGNCSGPWTGVSPDGKDLTIILTSEGTGRLSTRGAAALNIPEAFATASGNA